MVVVPEVAVVVTVTKLVLQVVEVTIFVKVAVVDLAVSIGAFRQLRVCGQDFVVVVVGL